MNNFTKDKAKLSKNPVFYFGIFFPKREMMTSILNV